MQDANTALVQHYLAPLALKNRVISIFLCGWLMREDTLLQPEVLVFLMLTMAAADGQLNDTETARIARLVAVLPVFENLPDNQIPDIIDHFAALMSDEAGLDTLMELVT